METFASLREYRVVRLEENKDRFIQKNTLLTDEQKQEVLEFFHSHANLEAKVNNGNWNYNIPYEEFKRVIDSVDTQAKRLKKQSRELRQQTGLEGLEKGKDYSILIDTPEYTAYQPFNHKAMRVIASNMVEPKIWCESSAMTWSPKEVLPEGEPMKGDLYPGAKWCVAMETDEHWRSYTRQGYRFVVVCSKNPETKETFKKICLVYNSGELYRRSSVTASDISIYLIQNSYIETVIADLDTVIHAPSSEKIQKCYCPEKGVYQLSGEMDILPQELLRIGKLDHPVIWEGDFIIKDNTIRSLVGCPDIVTGDFECRFCKNLTSLEGAPKRVGGKFNCSCCESLTSLKGAPERVEGRFSCTRCELLTSLEGAPKYVGGDFECNRCYDLTSLKGAPEYVGGIFDCNCCESLTSLKGAPEKIRVYFDCSSCESLTSLEGAPREVEGSFNCSDCLSLTSLEGAPRYVKETFWCERCTNLTSLEGAPEYIGGKLVH